MLTLVRLLRKQTSLKVKGTECYNLNGRPILKFSKEFYKTLEKYTAQGYSITRCTVNHIIYWTNEETGNEIRIVMPEV